MSAIIVLRLRVLAAGALLALGAPLAVAEGNGAEPDCSPHPWDIMAIHALRQSVG